MFPWTTCSAFKVRCIIIVIVIITPISSCIVIIIVITVECKSAAFWIFNNFSFKLIKRTYLMNHKLWFMTDVWSWTEQGFTDRLPVLDQLGLICGSLAQSQYKRSKTIPCEVANKKRQNFISLFRYSNKANLNFLKQKIENFEKFHGW